MCSKDKPDLHNKIYSPQPAAVAGRTPEQRAAAVAERALTDNEVPGISNTVTFQNRIEALSGSPLIKLSSERKELGIPDIDIKNDKHKPSKDVSSVKLNRIISSLMPEVEGIDEDIFFIENVTKYQDLNKK